MHLLSSLALPLLAAAPVFHYQVAGDRPGSWPRILSSAGLVRGAGGITFVSGSAATQDPDAWLARAHAGAVLILEGESPVAEALGIVVDRARRPVPTRSVVDTHNPKLAIVWERTMEISRYKLREKSVVFSRKRWDGAPLMAGVRHGAGAVLWLAVSTGEKGHERFPYLMQALADLGAKPGLDRVSCGLSSMRRTGAASISTISRHVGGAPVSRRCMWRRGIFSIRMCRKTNISSV